MFNQFVKKKGDDTVDDELPRIYLAKQAVRGVAHLQGGDCRISSKGQIQNVDPLGQSKPFLQVPIRH